MEPSVLTVYECPFPKKRLGKEYDGGYVIAEIPDAKYSILLAGGIADDISFEEDFVKKFGVRCVAFDGTINQLPSNNNVIEFVKKNIGSENTSNVTNLHDLIAQNDNIFVKMDVEGAEFQILAHLIKNNALDYIDHITVNFQDSLSPYNSTADAFIDIINSFNSKFRKWEK